MIKKEINNFSTTRLITRSCRVEIPTQVKVISNRKLAKYKKVKMEREGKTSRREREETMAKLRVTPVN